MQGWIQSICLLPSWKFHEGNEQIDGIHPCIYELFDGNEQDDSENIIFSYANIADCKIAEKLAEVVKGTIFADAGYLQKKDVLKRMEEKGIKFEAAPRIVSNLVRNFIPEKSLKSIMQR